MSMVTSCPGCTTTFRITPEQLKHRAGKVRCSKCNGVFDAFKTLASLPDDPPANSGTPSLADSADTTPAPPGFAPATAPVQGSLDIGSSIGVASVAPAAAPSAAAASRRKFWIAGVVVLCVALVLQLGYALRAQIAATWPATRPALERLCEPLGCSVPLPRRTEQLAIESSDLQADPKRANAVILTATLRNRGSGVVAHPALELTLTNAQDQGIAKRIFQPSDYLADPSAAAQGMPAMSEVNVRIVLDTGELKPAGYRLFLFYP